MHNGTILGFLLVLSLVVHFCFEGEAEPSAGHFSLEHWCMLRCLLGPLTYSHSLDCQTQLLQTGLVESHWILWLQLRDKERTSGNAKKQVMMDIPLVTGYDNGGYLHAWLFSRGAGISRGRCIRACTGGGKRGPVITFHGHWGRICSGENIRRLCVILFFPVSIIHDLQFRGNNCHQFDIPVRSISWIFCDNWIFLKLSENINILECQCNRPTHFRFLLQE